MPKLPEVPAKGNHPGLVEKVNEIVGFIELAVDSRAAAHEVEEGLWRRVLKIGRDSLAMFFALHGDGEEGETVSLPGVGEVKRLEQPHERRYLSVFGEFELKRVVYGTRERQKIEYVPLVCRHSQCDLHTTTNILATDLASKCSVPFAPAVPGTDTKASAMCCTSDVTVAEFKTLCGKMDASNPDATTVEAYLGGTPGWRTDLYSTCGTVLSHAESIELFASSGRSVGSHPDGGSVTD